MLAFRPFRVLPAIAALSLFFPAVGCDRNWVSRGSDELSISEIVKADAQPASHGRQVRTIATVLYSDEEWRLLFVTDGRLGMYIDPPHGLELQSGDLLQIEGTNASFGKGLENVSIFILKRGSALPAPFAVHASSELTSLLSQWVAVTGTIQWKGVENGRAVAQIRSGDQSCSVLVQNADTEQLPPVGSRVTVTGVSAGNFDANGQLTGARVLSPSPRYLEVRKLGPASLFSVPLTAPGKLMQLEKGAIVHLTGDVTSAVHRASLVSGRTWVEFTSPNVIPSGHFRAEVAGFWNGTAIEDAQVRPVDEPKYTGKGAIVYLKELKRLSSAEAEKGLPVSVRGVVTYFDSAWGLLFIQDGSAAVFVNARGTTTDLKPGSLVHVEGVTGRGDFAPVIRKAKITFVGSGRLPKPARIVSPEPNLDKLDSQWCRVEGVIHTVHQQSGHTFISLGFDGSDIVLQFPAAIAVDDLVDARVSVTGAFGTVLNDRNQAIGYKMFVPSPAFITKLQRPAGVDVVQTIDSLRRYEPMRDQRYSVTLQGIEAVKKQTDVVFIQDGTAGIEVHGDGPLDTSDGDIVTVRGFIAPGDYSLILEDARVLSSSRGVPPNAEQITPKMALTGAYDSEFVQIRATVRDIQRSTVAITVGLISDGVRFDAVGPSDFENGSLRPGSVVEVRGICRVIADRSAVPPAIREFSLIFDSQRSITVVKPAPWWNSHRFAWALLTVMGVALFVLIWAAILRRKVAGKTRELQYALDAQQKLQTFELARNAVLETIAANGPLRVGMEKVVTAVEEQLRNARCMIVLAPKYSAEFVSANAPLLAVAPRLPEGVASAVQKKVGEYLATQPGMSDTAGVEQLRRQVLEAAESAGVTHADIAIVASGAYDAVGAVLTFFKLPHGKPSRSEGMVIESAVRLISIAYEHWDMHERLLHEAQHDPLTGLPNRSLAEDRLEHALARAQRTKRPFAVLCIDLDGFKHVNDKFGHLAGDELLRMVAARFQARMRKSDTIGRMGGDEFIAVVEECLEPRDAVNVAQGLIATLEEPFAIEGADVSVRASIGIGIFPRDGDTPTVLKRHADQAMYTAKTAGGNQIYCWADLQAGRSGTEIEDLLRTALEQNLFELRYQPIFNVDGTPASVEALLRLRGPSGLLMPDDFIEVAERSGLIMPIGKWVMEEACRRLLEWKGRGFSVRVAINASARQFVSSTFADMVAEVLATYKVDPSMLEIELTETVVMSDVRESTFQMAHLKRLGIHIAVDDFGTGYSSLNYLHTLPIDILKIDRSFTRGIGEPGGSRPIVDAVVQMARTFGMVTVLEGVETPEQLRAARAAGCDRVQGYLFSEPLGADEIVAALNTGISHAREDEEVPTEPEDSENHRQEITLGRHIVPSGR